MVSGSKDSSLRAWDLRTGRARLVSTQHFGGVQCLALDASADGGRGAYYSGARDATVQVCPLPVNLFSTTTRTTLSCITADNKNNTVPSCLPIRLRIYSAYGCTTITIVVAFLKTGVGAERPVFAHFAFGSGHGSGIYMYSMGGGGYC